MADGDNDKFTKCRLCKELYTEPKMLPCMHSFCRRCLEKFDEQQTTSQSHGARVTCPCCEKEFPLPVGGVAQLPVNVFFARLAESRRSDGNVNNRSSQVKYSFVFKKVSM